jgi:glutaredoxin
MNELKLFTKNGCAPCVVAKRLADRIDACDTISLDEHPEYIDQYNLSSTPTLLYNGDLIVSIDDIMETLGWILNE